YGVRSARNWGMGDFTDLEDLIRLAHRLGADGIGLNPLHALFDDRPTDCSPYSPNSRLFLNGLDIYAERAPGYQPIPEGDALAWLRQSSSVDYAGVAALKWRALRSAFEKFRADPNAALRKDLDAFRAEHDKVEVEFVEYVQWIADRQLGGCKMLAETLGMKVGHYLDVAVGVQP